MKNYPKWFYLSSMLQQIIWICLGLGTFFLLSCQGNHKKNSVHYQQLENMWYQSVSFLERKEVNELLDLWVSSNYTLLIQPWEPYWLDSKEKMSYYLLSQLEQIEGVKFNTRKMKVFISPQKTDAWIAIQGILNLQKQDQTTIALELSLSLYAIQTKGVWHFNQGTISSPKSG